MIKHENMLDIFSYKKKTNAKTDRIVLFVLFYNCFNLFIFWEGGGYENWYDMVIKQIARSSVVTQRTVLNSRY